MSQNNTNYAYDFLTTQYYSKYPHYQLQPQYVQTQFTQPNFGLYQQNQEKDLSFDIWWNKYMAAMYMIARTINVNDKQTVAALKTFFLSLFKLIPNAIARQYMQQFLQLSPQVVDQMIETCPSLFATYTDLETIMKTNPKEFHDSCMKNIDGQSLLIWVYLINVFIHGVLKAQSIHINLPTLNDVRNIYHPERITKYEWGNAVWFVIHTISLYAPQPCSESILNFKRFLYSLQWLLPCPKCRLHLSKNLKYIDLDNCPKSNEALFKCTWQLHNIVNKSDDKPEMSLQEAFSLYTF